MLHNLIKQAFNRVGFYFSINPNVQLYAGYS